MLSKFPILTPFLFSLFAYFKQTKKYIIKQRLFTLRQIAPSEPTYFLNFFRGRYSRKLIHTKINPRKVYIYTLHNHISVYYIDIQMSFFFLMSEKEIIN